MGAWTPSGSVAKKRKCVATWLFSRPSGAIGKTCGRSQKIGHKGGWNIKHRVPPSPYPWPSGAICVVAMTRWEGTPGADEHPSHRNHAAPVERNGKLKDEN